MTKRKRRQVHVLFRLPGSVIQSAGLRKVSFYSVECWNAAANGPWKAVTQ